MKLSIIIPAHNEEKNIGNVLRSVFRSPINLTKEIIVVDDGSTDGTKEKLEQLKKQFDFILITLAQNSGKGSAIKRGAAKASGDYILIQDADLEYNLLNYPRLIEPLVQGETDVIYGSRLLKPNPNIYPHYLWGNKFVTFCFNILFGTQLTDVYTGYKILPLKVFRKLNLNSHGFEFEAEITAQLVKAGFKIKEVPIDYRPRTFKEGKKIRIKDGFLGLWQMIKARLRK